MSRFKHLMIRCFPATVAIQTRDDATRRAALEVLRLRRKDADLLLTYLIEQLPEREN